MRHHFGRAYTERIMRMVEDYCAEYLFDGYMVKEDGNGRLIVYTDDDIHSYDVADAINEFGIDAEVTNRGTQIHIEY